MKGPLDTSLAYKYFMSYRLLDGQRYDETVVPYRPTRSFRNLVKLIVRKQKHLQLFFSILIAAVSMAMLVPGFGAYAGLLLSVFLFAAITLPLIPVVQSWKHATHVGVSPKGIRLYSLHWYGDKVSKPIPWEEISGLTLGWRPSNFGQNDWIDIWGNEAEPKKVMSLALDGIVAGEPRKRFLAAIKQFVAVQQIDTPLQDALNPVKLGTHTQMWLDVLSNSPKRLIEHHLDNGQLICNGRYRITEQLGIGGQAVAYVADQIDEANSKTVVLKEFVLPAEASLRVSRRAFEAIERESELLAQISHPRIVALLDLFVDDHRAYMVLERVPGRNLRQHVHERGIFGEPDVIELALQMCDVLRHLHSLKPPVIHRDFTPDNLIFDPDTGIKLIDFNVAQHYEASATRTVVGKHSYIPPEQFRGKACPQSDLYALGATMFYLLTGEEPEPIMVAHPKKLLPMISDRLDAVVAKCTAQDLAARYQNSEEIAADLLALKDKGLAAI